MNGKKVQEDDEEAIDLIEQSTQNAEIPSGPESEAVQYAPSSSPAASRPPSSATDFDDDFDLDAVIREDEERLSSARAMSPTDIAPPITSTQQRFAEDGDEALWNMFDDVPVPELPVPPPPLATANRSTDRDEDVWDVVQELENESAPSFTALVPPLQATTVGGSMMDIVGEAEEGWDDVYE